VEDKPGRRELAIATATALIFGFCMSWGYELSRYLGIEIGPHDLTGSMGNPHSPDGLK
jgi:hypothetical protein